MKYVNNNHALPEPEHEQQSRPLITIVTVVFNGKKFLEKTIQSVIGQNYGNLEYIVIDGGSTDGTLDIIKKYEDKIDYWVSEQDKGIYDAMNKGIRLAAGEWINFMNAGDTFDSSDILVTVFGSKEYDADILFGNVRIKYPGFFRIQRAGKPSHLWRGMQFCHQSVFVRSSLHKPKPFNAANLIAADFQFYYESYKNKLVFEFVDHVIASVDTGGVSDSNRIETIDAWRDVVCATGYTFPVKLHYEILKIDVKIRSILKKILPKKIIRSILINKK